MRRSCHTFGVVAMSRTWHGFIRAYARVIFETIGGFSVTPVLDLNTVWELPEPVLDSDWLLAVGIAMPPTTRDGIFILRPKTPICAYS